jgi:hypothetical protein
MVKVLKAKLEEVLMPMQKSFHVDTPIGGDHSDPSVLRNAEPPQKLAPVNAYSRVVSGSEEAPLLKSQALHITQQESPSGLAS